MSLETGRKEDAIVKIVLFHTSTLKTALPSNTYWNTVGTHTLLWSVSYMGQDSSVGELDQAFLPE